jgi:hypothetical protein
MKLYLRILSVLYFLGFTLHLLDLFDLRLSFSQMNLTWKLWILFLLIADLLAAIGLWKLKQWGVYLFLLIATTQIIAYYGFFETIKNQNFLLVFHVLTVTSYFTLVFWQSNKKSTTILN